MVKNLFPSKQKETAVHLFDQVNGGFLSVPPARLERAT